jgi:hypothetical protein
MNADGMPLKPWYRERWPWILMAGPATAVVAGLFTAWLAVRSDDGLVVDDYYRQGLAINQTLSRTDAAERRGIEAQLDIDDGHVRVRLAAAAASGGLTLRLVHPTRAGLDQSTILAEAGPGAYAGRLQPLPPGRWHVVLEGRDWRLAGDWVLPPAGTLTLSGHFPAPGGDDKSKEGKR